MTILLTSSCLYNQSLNNRQVASDNILKVFQWTAVDIITNIRTKVCHKMIRKETAEPKCKIFGTHMHVLTKEVCLPLIFG